MIELITMLSWVFAYVYSMTGGGPGFASSVLELYIWKNAFAYRAIGIASAVAVLLLVADERAHRRAAPRPRRRDATRARSEQ